MDEKRFLAERFEADRARLTAVAYRMLGSRTEAEDAVQEAWLRLARAETGKVDNLLGWLTTVVARICLDMLRQRTSRREDALDEAAPEPVASGRLGDDPEEDALLADSIGVALLVVLETLAPAERVAFVLHDMFDVSFDEIAPIVGRTPVAARQLASRARRRVQGAGPAPSPDRRRRQGIVEAFLAAARSGDFESLLNVLDPDVAFRADDFAARIGGGVAKLNGARAVAETFQGRAQAARVAYADGELAFAVRFGEDVGIVVLLGFEGDRISRMEAIADPQRIAGFQLEVVEE